MKATTCGLLCLLASVGVLLPAAAASADKPSDSRVSRGIRISKAGLVRPNSFQVSVRWDQQGLRSSKRNAMSVSLVATTGTVGKPVFTKAVAASAGRPSRSYPLSLTKSQQKLVSGSGGLGVAASQRTLFRGGLYRRAWVARSGDFPSRAPKAETSRSKAFAAVIRCNPLQAGGTYQGCYYGYTDLSNLDVHGSNFSEGPAPYPIVYEPTDFSFSTLTGTDFSGSNLTLAMFSYANLVNANLSNADLNGAYLYGANLSGANVTGADFTNAQYCNTQMPNGTVNNTNC